MSTQQERFGDIPRSAFDVPGRSGGLLDVIRWRYLLHLLVRTGVTTRYRSSVLGWTWSYIRPAAQFFVFWLVMGVFIMRGGGIPNYAVYLFSGIVIINLFSEAFKNATTSIVGNASLVRKVFLPRQLFAVSAAMVACVHFLPQVALLLVVVIILGWLAQLTVMSILAMVAAIVIVLITALGLGLLFGAINVRFRDAENIVELILMLTTWASPVLYSWTMVRDVVSIQLGMGWLTQLYLLNPITQAVELFHYAFWEPVTRTPIVEAGLELPPNLAIFTLWSFLIAVATLLIGQVVFRRLEGKFAQDL